MKKINVKLLKEYSDFISNIMDKEHKATLVIIKKDFRLLDKKVITTLMTDELETEEKMMVILNLIENFKDKQQALIGANISKLSEEKKPILVNKMTEISLKDTDLLSDIGMLEQLMGATQIAFDTYVEECMDYVCYRLADLMDIVEEELGIKEELDEIQEQLKNEEDLEMMNFIISMLKYGINLR